MMRTLILILIFASSIYYMIYQRRHKEIEKQTFVESKKQELKKVIPQLPEYPKNEFKLTFSQETINTLKRLTQDSDEKVRLSAIELLWELQDQDIGEIIKRSFDTETSSEIKVKIIEKIAKDKTKFSLRLIAYALKNYDKQTKLKACEVLGDFIDKETIDVLTPALNDYDEEVRLKALESINKVKKAIEEQRAQKLQEITQPQPVFRVE